MIDCDVPIGDGMTRYWSRGGGPAKGGRGGPVSKSGTDANAGVLSKPEHYCDYCSGDHPWTQCLRVEEIEYYEDYQAVKRVKLRADCPGCVTEYDLMDELEQEQVPYNWRPVKHPGVFSSGEEKDELAHSNEEVLLSLCGCDRCKHLRGE